MSEDKIQFAAEMVGGGPRDGQTTMVDPETNAILIPDVDDDKFIHVYVWEGALEDRRRFVYRGRDELLLVKRRCQKCKGLGWNHDGFDPLGWYACSHCRQTGYHDATGKPVGDPKPRPTS